MEEKKEKEDELEAERRKVTQAEFDQICSEGANFWLIYSPGSVHEFSVNIGNTHSAEGSKKYLDDLLSVLRFGSGVTILIHVPSLPKTISVWSGTGEMELANLD